MLAEVEKPVVVWPVRLILPNPLNPRGEILPESLDELAASIRVKGILTPLLITPWRDAAHVVSGHRRRAAAIMAGLTELPVIVHRFTEQEQIEIMLVENLQREDLTPVEEARGYARALEGARTVAELSRRLGVHKGRINERLTLLRLAPGVQKMIERRELRLSLVPALLTVEDPDDQQRLAALAVRRGLTPEQLAVHITHEAEEIGGEGLRAADDETVAAAAPAGRAAQPRGLTRSEAAAMIEGEGSVSFSELRRALERACECDEASHPEVCRACPLPQFVARLTARA